MKVKTQKLKENIKVTVQQMNNGRLLTGVGFSHSKQAAFKLAVGRIAGDLQ